MSTPNNRRRNGAPTWWLLFTRELTELWMGGKAPVLLLIFCVLLGIMSWVMASSSELSLMPPEEMVFETSKAAIAVGLFIALIIGADSISGERERATIEGLLLTPTSRRQIVVGKYLAAITPWPVAMLISIPYMSVLSQGNEVFPAAVLWGTLVGALLAPAFTAIGMLASFWANSNKTSLFTALGFYVLFQLLSQLPMQAGFASSMVQLVNPIAATNLFLQRLLMSNRTFAECSPFLISSIVFGVIVHGLLFLYAAPRLRLDGGTSSPFWTGVGRKLGLATVVWFLAVPMAAPLMAQSQPAIVTSSLKVDVDLAYKTVKTGDAVVFHTAIANTGAEKTAPLSVAINVINLDAAGEVVDPEDWSPQRTQYIDSLAPGKSVTLTWRVNAILDGDYLIYMAVIPEPAGAMSTSQPVASPAIHLTVTPFTKLNPGGVLPYAIGGPILLLLGMSLLSRYRRRQVETGALGYQPGGRR